MKLDRIRALVVDLDGVVYIENRLLPRVAKAIATLRARGLRVLFVTNNSDATRAGFARRLRRLGIPCRTAEMMNAARAAAVHLRRRIPPRARLFVFGIRGLARELVAAGFTVVTVRTRQEWDAFRTGYRRVHAVVTGFNRSVTYWSLCAAHYALTRGANLVACNLDSTYPVKWGTMPGTGSLVRLLEVSSGKKPILIGKPSPVMFRMFFNDHGLSPSEVLVVGDRIEIDIEGGHAAGARTALVLTGIATKEDVRRARRKPDLVLREFADLTRQKHLGLRSGGTSHINRPQNS